MVHQTGADDLPVKQFLDDWFPGLTKCYSEADPGTAALDIGGNLSGLKYF